MYILKTKNVRIFRFPTFVVWVLFELKRYGNQFTFNPKHLKFFNPPPRIFTTVLPYLIVKRTQTTKVSNLKILTFFVFKMYIYVV